MRGPIRALRRIVARLAVPALKPLLCRFERHMPAPFPRWNDGYYFSKCLRCGEDLVRVAGERWQRPHGFRVVWSAEPPPRPEPPRIVTPADATQADVTPADVDEPDATRVEADVVQAGLVEAEGVEAEAMQETAPLHEAREASLNVTVEDDGGVTPSTALDADRPIVVEDPAEPVAVAHRGDVLDEVAGVVAADDAPDDIGDQLNEPPPPGSAAEAAPESVPPARRSVVPDFMDDDFPRTPEAEPYVTTVSQIAGVGDTTTTVGDAGPSPAGKSEADDRWGLNRIGLKYLSGAVSRRSRGGASDNPAARSLGSRSLPSGSSSPAARAPRFALSPSAPSPVAAPMIQPLAIARSAIPAAVASSGKTPTERLPGTYQAAAWATVLVLLVAVARLIFPAGDSAAKPVAAPVSTQPAKAPVRPLPRPAASAADQTAPDVVPDAAADAAPPAAADAATEAKDASVSASILSCRDAPTRSAARTMTLSRGLRVEVLASAGDWSQVEYHGKPCWVASRLLAAE